MTTPVAILGAGRIGRPIAATFALGGCPVRLVDLKDRPVAARTALFAEARREIARDLSLMAEIYDRVQRLAPAYIARAGLRVDWTWPAR